MINSNGDGSAYVKYSNGGVVIGTGNSDRLTVNNLGDVTVSGDLNVAAGMVRDAQFVSYRVNQGTTPLMSSSIVDFSGTAALGNSTRIVFTRIPLMRAGSVLGISLLTQNCTVKSGSLSGTVLISGVPTAATVGMNTGTIATSVFNKDSITFGANSYLEVQLTASSTYLTDLDPTSGSFMCLVSVEY